MYRKITIISLVLVILPLTAFAADYVYGFTMLSDSGEGVIEVINLVLAVLAAAFAIKLAALSQGGDLEKTWNWLAIAASVFALLEIYGALKGFEILHVSGLDDIIEFIMVVILLYIFVKTRKLLLKRTMGK